MFSYYGKKAQLAKYYHGPMYDTIIEPFAGSAAYSLYGDNWEKNVILVDKYDVVVKVWKYLQNASENDILKLPDVDSGVELEKVNGFSQLLQEEKWLIGFAANPGSAQPKNVTGKFSSWPTEKVKIAQNLHKIKHCTIICGDYKDIQNQKATWFIDPPYQCGGQWYKHKTIDYDHLAKWCEERMGQVIVCENSGASWLPFVVLRSLSGQLRETLEVVYYQYDQTDSSF